MCDLSVHSVCNKPSLEQNIVATFSQYREFYCRPTTFHFSWFMRLMLEHIGRPLLYPSGFMPAFISFSLIIIMLIFGHATYAAFATTMSVCLSERIHVTRESRYGIEICYVHSLLRPNFPIFNLGVHSNE